jgi:hypothetical protein
MKNRMTVGLCLLIFTLYSCSKTNTNKTPVDPNLKMTYFFNDTLVTISGNAVRNNNTTAYLNVETGPEYILEGQDSGTVNHTVNAMQVFFVHDTLIGNSSYYVPDSFRVQTYDFSIKTNSSYPAILFGRFNGLVRMFELVNPTDHFTCTISRYSNGTIDGTFSGVLTRMGYPQSVAGGQTAVITNGQFSNVPILR